MKQSISCNLVGGLGNQFFQIATSLAYSYYHNIQAIFEKKQDIPCIFSPKPSYWDSYFHQIKTTNKPLTETIYQEPYFHYTTLPKFKINILLNGYFQSYKYFDFYKTKILKTLKLPQDIIKKTHQKYNIETWKTTKPIAIHIRRGDYLKLKNHHTVLSETTYYQKAIQQFPANSTFIVFSDDIEWCKKNIKLITTPFQYKIFPYLKNKIHQRRNFIFYEDSDIVELYLMSQCYHHIIANSSFSWWGAYLSPNKGKVIAPKKWFGKKIKHSTKDLLLPTWTQL